jgi:hypothetical protein
MWGPVVGGDGALNGHGRGGLLGMGMGGSTGNNDWEGFDPATAYFNPVSSDFTASHRRRRRATAECPIIQLSGDSLSDI